MLLGASAALWAGNRVQIVPHDESGTDIAFLRFLQNLRLVAKERNGAQLLPLCAPNVITGIDSPAGPAALVKKMEAGDWAALQSVLEKGASKNDGGFVIPYYFVLFPEELDALEHVIVVRPNAVLRAAASAEAPVVSRLDYDILKAGEMKRGAAWIQAARLDGPKGWVAAADVRTMGAERMFFGRIRGAWKITAWASGD